LPFEAGIRAHDGFTKVEYLLLGFPVMVATQTIKDTEDEDEAAGLGY
jgi:hypothetical protein